VRDDPDAVRLREKHVAAMHQTGEMVDAVEHIETLTRLRPSWLTRTLLRLARLCYVECLAVEEKMPESFAFIFGCFLIFISIKVLVYVFDRVDYVAYFGVLGSFLLFLIGGILLLFCVLPYPPTIFGFTDTFPADPHETGPRLIVGTPRLRYALSNTSDGYVSIVSLDGEGGWFDTAEFAECIARFVSERL
jgi:hypothetical protein